MSPLNTILSFTSVQQLLHSVFDAMTPTPPIVVVDEQYSTVEPDTVLASITADPILASSSFRQNVFDCDDYVLYLRTKVALFASRTGLPAPLAVGYLITAEHAFNFCIDPAQRITLIDTQSNTVPSTNDPAEFTSFLNLTPGNTLALVYI